MMFDKVILLGALYFVPLAIAQHSQSGQLIEAKAENPNIKFFSSISSGPMLNHINNGLYIVGKSKPEGKTGWEYCSTLNEIVDGIRDFGMQLDGAFAVKCLSDKDSKRIMDLRNNLILPMIGWKTDKNSLCGSRTLTAAEKVEIDRLYNKIVDAYKKDWVD